MNRLFKATVILGLVLLLTLISTSNNAFGQYRQYNTNPYNTRPYARPWPYFPQIQPAPMYNQEFMRYLQEQRRLEYQFQLMQQQQQYMQRLFQQRQAFFNQYGYWPAY